MNSILYMDIPKDLKRIILSYVSNEPNILVYIKKNNIIPYNKIIINWYELSISSPLTVEFIDCFFNKIKWDMISKYYILDDLILYRYYDKLNWNYVCRYQKLSMSFIIDNADLINFDSLLLNRNYPVNYIKDFIRTKEGQEKLYKILKSKRRYKKIFDSFI